MPLARTADDAGSSLDLVRDVWLHARTGRFVVPRRSGRPLEVWVEGGGLVRSRQVADLVLGAGKPGLRFEEGQPDEPGDSGALGRALLELGRREVVGVGLPPDEARLGLRLDPTRAEEIVPAAVLTALGRTGRSLGHVLADERVRPIDLLALVRLGFVSLEAGGGWAGLFGPVAVGLDDASDCDVEVVDEHLFDEAEHSLPAETEAAAAPAAGPERLRLAAAGGFTLPEGLAEALAAVGAGAGAEPELGEALEAGRGLLLAGRLEESLLVLVAAEERWPGLPALDLHLAWALLFDGKGDRAAALASDAVARGYADPHVIALAGLLSAHVGTVAGR